MTGKPKDTVRWNESVLSDKRTLGLANVVVRSICELQTGPKRLVDALYFDGLDILHCHEGHFLFAFKDGPSVELLPGETLVTYPRHVLTIDALEPDNRLVYGIFDGSDAEAYFDALGFFDCAKGRTESHHASIMALREQLEGSAKGGAVDAASWLSHLTDILSSQAAEMRRHNDTLVFDAMRQIHRNLRARVTQLKPLCEQLGVSRVQLHRHFTAVGAGSPSDYIRGRQLHIARDLLENGDLAFSEIAERTGFLSPAHFTTFVKRMTGLTPTQIRKGQC